MELKTHHWVTRQRVASLSARRQVTEVEKEEPNADNFWLASAITYAMELDISNRQAIVITDRTC